MATKKRSESIAELQQLLVDYANIKCNKSIECRDKKGKPYPGFTFEGGYVAGEIRYYGESFIMVFYTSYAKKKLKIFDSNQNVSQFLRYWNINNNKTYAETVPDKDTIKKAYASQSLNSPK